MNGKTRNGLAIGSIMLCSVMLSGNGWAGQEASGTGLRLAAENNRDAPLLVARSGIGPYLTDGKGRTLYYFKKDSSGRTACFGVCLAAWHPFYAEHTAAPAGAEPGDFGSFTRPDGLKQNTFRGWPLYYFSGDKNPGDTKGHAVNGVWYAVDPALTSGP